MASTLLAGSLSLLVMDDERTTALRSNSVLMVGGGGGVALRIRHSRGGGGMDGGRGVNPFVLVVTEEGVGVVRVGLLEAASFMKKKLPSLEEEEGDDESFSSAAAKKKSGWRWLDVDFVNDLGGGGLLMPKADATPMLLLMPTMGFASSC